MNKANILEKVVFAENQNGQRFRVHTGREITRLVGENQEFADGKKIFTPDLSYYYLYDINMKRLH